MMESKVASMTEPSLLRGPTADAAPFVHEKMLALLDGEKRGLLLDAPAGRGAFALQAKRLGYDVTCGDIECARFEAEGLTCGQVDLNRAWPYGDARFDAVACIEAIEHLENPWLLVREANRVLKPGGVFLVTTPNVLSIKSRMSYLLNGYPNYFFFGVVPGPGSDEELPIDHINPVGYLELRHILARSGFHIEAIDTNRYVHRNRLLTKVLKFFIRSRWRRRTRNNPAEIELRTLMLSPAILYGEILLVKARKFADV
jgi:2-polyprenyl-3-methyl-5-hydroxy-6-metoxy-1,4-benzoquinol methylase